MSQAIDIRRPSRSDTYDLRERIHSDDNEHIQAHADAANYMDDEEQHSVLEDDSDGEDQQEIDDDDMSSDLSIPNESIDFDLVYAFHSFAATVEGQANVVKGDSLFLMDDSNSYWWLVRVLKTQEVGYIPAENIETPFERLARLNKHRNVDLAKATEAEERLHINRKVSKSNSPGPRPGSASGDRSKSDAARSVIFNSNFQVNRYPPAIWIEDELDDEEDEWDDEPYEYDDEDLMEEQAQDGIFIPERTPPVDMEPDDGMDWDDSAVEEMRVQQAGKARQAAILAEASKQELLAQKQLDPAEVMETKKITMTPDVARAQDVPPQQPKTSSGPMLPSAVLQQRQVEDEKKRLREEEEEAARKRARGKMPPPVSSPQQGKPSVAAPVGGKLRKAPSESESDDGRGKKRGMLSSLFGRKKEKNTTSKGGSVDLGGERDARTSSESGGTIRPSGDIAGVSPTTNAAMQQQSEALRNSTDPKQQQQQNTGAAPSSPPQVSQLRQRDQQQQLLYQQYLNRSPSSAPEAQPSYGLQSASAVLQDRPMFHSSTGSGSSGNGGLGIPAARPRPGSLVMSSPSANAVPDLSVIRVFAGRNLQTDATFKTVLLNASTTSRDLVRQGLQRFRLGDGEDAGEYYLTVKQVEGGESARLRDEENPLVVFETLVQEAEGLEMPKVKRSSVGSISSVSSNLSMHPAIRKLPMNDFTDDSAVKFYLNRRAEGGEAASDEDVAGDETIIAADTSVDGEGHYLSVGADRFSSPSFRFGLQLAIYPADLPDDMAFDTLTEAIVFKETLRERERHNSNASISMEMRRKVFVVPKNITVAEVIELGLERFGIQEGVVDGGDEVEDKNINMKRRSLARVRYGLAVSVGGQERELSPSSKVIDAFPHPPTYKNADRRSNEMKRRSFDSTQLLGTLDDVAEDDPIFILRRAVSYRNSSSRRRMSAPLDEIALRNLHRESASSNGSEQHAPDTQKPALSHREIIEAQRQAKRENQRAILSAQTNEVRGLDVLLPGNTMLRSARYDVNDRMRYSYVDTDGETYDISDIVEEEWRDGEGRDLLQGVLDRTNKDGGVKLHRVLSKIRSGKGRAAGSSRSPTPTLSRSVSPGSQYSVDPAAVIRRPGTTTPTQGASSSSRRHPSIGSVMSDFSGYATAPTPGPERGKTPVVTVNKGGGHGLRLPKDDFGMGRMMAVIECRAMRAAPVGSQRKMDEVEEMLFGRSMANVDLSVGRLHPKVREVYAASLKELEGVDKFLDDLLMKEVARRGQEGREVS